MYATGAEALDQLLRQTKLLYTNGYDKVLIKGGGYRQAISDFNSVHPDVTRRNSKQVSRLFTKFYSA